MYFSELYKLKRNSILVLTFSIIIVLGGISIIQGKASGKVSFNSLYELLIWNGFSLFIPMLSTLFTGYLINLEFTNDTYKNYMIVPIRMKEIIKVKLFVGFLFTEVTGVMVSLFLFVTCFFMDTVSILDYIHASINILVFYACSYVAVLPIIILCTKKENGYLAGVGISFFYNFCSIFVANGNLVSFYPITAGLGIIKYENSVSGQIPYNTMISFISLLCVAFTSFVIFRLVYKEKN